MKLFVCANNYTEKQHEETVKCVEVLRKLGHECFSDKEDDCINKCDLIVSLGGDGALLNAAQYALEADKPLFGINSGRLGHLCAMTIEDIEKFDSIYSKCQISERSVLQTSFNNKEYLSVNDVIISKSEFGQTADISSYVDGKLIQDIRGDGLIISSPTGSSAYNVSAGGPLIDCDAKCFVLTPICQHGSGIYPYVVNDNKNITVKVDHEQVRVYADGRYIGQSDEDIEIVKAHKNLKLYVH